MDINERFAFEDQLALNENPARKEPPTEEVLTLNDASGKTKRNKKQLLLLGIASGVFLAVCIFLMLLSSSGNGRVFPVYITEILASNTSYPNSDGRCCDYIELYNSADYTVDLSGYQLGDISGGNRYRFASGTTIAPHTYLVIYCDKTVPDTSYAPFGISRGGGETFYLISTNNAIADSVVTIPTDLDQSMILVEKGSWTTSPSPTPGRDNNDISGSGQVLYNPDVSPVRITELSSSETGYSREHAVHCDWIELHNTLASPVDISGFVLSDNLGADKYIFPEGTILSGGEYLVVPCSDEVTSDLLAPFGLSQAGGESVVLKNSKGMIVEIVDCLPQNNGESLELGSDGLWSVTEACSPGFENGAEGHAAYLESIGLGARTVVISEVMAASQAVLADCFGDFSDWIELYNTGNATVDLSGWYLSDDPNAADKWTLPQLELQPGQRIVIFCSGQDTVQDGQIHTGFSLASSGETLVLSSFSGISVDTVSFGKSEENCSLIVDNQTAELTQTYYPTPGYANDADGYERFCAAATAKGPLAIWEVMTANDWYLPQALGACYDWVELRNISDTSILLSDYSITDDPDTPNMYALPDKMLAPGATIVILLSGDESLSDGRYSHAGFSLNAMEDRLLLYDRTGSLLDYVYLREIPLSYSYGRSEETGGFFHMQPSPGNPNNPGTRLVSSMPISNIEPGVYTVDTGYLLSFSAPGDIYYTTDGADPDVTCLKYEEPIRVDYTTVIRAVSVEPGKLPSKIYTSTFVIQEPHSIPVVSLVTDPGNLWGARGIYKSGDISIKEQNRAANIAYSGADGSFSLDCEISLHGATTVRVFEKKSFSVRFQDAYDGRLNYDLFEDGEVTTFKSLILRTAHEDAYSSQMRDILMGYTASQVSDTLICQKYKYVAVYLNGEYWGLYALRELHSEEHFASYMDVPASSVSMIKHRMHPDTVLYPVYAYCERGGTYKSDAAYQEIKSLFDLNSFADWIIFQSYVSNIDIYGNMRYYYSSVDGLWRCGLVDVDLGMFAQNGFEAVSKSMYHGVVTNALAANEDFQDLLATRLAELLSGPMSDENMIARIDMLADTIRDEIPMERARWGGTAQQWEQMVVQLKDYCDGRAVEMIASLCAYLGFTAEEKEHYFGEILNK